MVVDKLDADRAIHKLIRHNEEVSMKFQKEYRMHIRDFPEDLRQNIKAMAAFRGESMRDYLIRVLDKETRKDMNEIVEERRDHEPDSEV